MITAIYMPRQDAILLADTDRDGAVTLPMAEARAIAETIGRADTDRQRACELAAPRHLARWPRGLRP